MPDKHSRPEFRELDKLPDDMLRELLTDDYRFYDGEPANTELILQVLALLEARAGGSLPYPEPEDSWPQLRKEMEALDAADIPEDPGAPLAALPAAGRTQARSARKYRRLFRAALVAAVFACLLLIATLGAYAAGYDPWGKLASWTTAAFFFQTEPAAESPDPNVLPPPPPEASGEETPEIYSDGTITFWVNIDKHYYPTLQAALDAYGITTPVMPTWIPDGFVIRELGVAPYHPMKPPEENPQVSFFAHYENGDKSLNISVFRNIDGTQYEKDGTAVKTYVSGGVTHYIMRNIDIPVAVWRNGNLECSLGGDISDTELIQMIDSIYEED